MFVLNDPRPHKNVVETVSLVSSLPCVGVRTYYVTYTSVLAAFVVSPGVPENALIPTFHSLACFLLRVILRFEGLVTGDGERPTRIWAGTRKLRQRFFQSQCPGKVLTPGPDLTQPGRANPQARQWPSFRLAFSAVENSHVVLSVFHPFCTIMRAIE